MDFLFFWGYQVRADGQLGPSCLCQWWPSEFTVEGVSYPTAEHYMMAEKARLFGDEEIRERILQAPDPSQAKALGRRVSGFDTARWEEVRLPIVVTGNLAKFGQDPSLRSYLLGTAPRRLVEASPVDRVWGIGLAAEDPRAQDPAQWQGLNLLGEALMDVREKLSVFDGSSLR